MAKTCPYLLRRRHTFFFRIAVPVHLRQVLGLTEITRSLGTSDRARATSQALWLASAAKRLFVEASAQMANTPMKQLLDHAMVQARLRQKLDELDAELFEQRLHHRKELELARLDAENKMLREMLQTRAPADVPTTSNNESFSQVVKDAQPTAAIPEVKLSKVIEQFLLNYPKQKSAAMFKKHKPVLGLFLEVVGDKPIHTLKQADINKFFQVVTNLPPRWKDECRRKNIGALELSEKEHLIKMSPKSFDDTYMASVRPFLGDCKVNWGDQGFPHNLTTEQIKYNGDEKEGKQKQRAFTDEELSRLFHGSEMLSFWNDKNQEHKYWLPCVAYYTGARVNEICQINPQSDVSQEGEIWYFDLTDDSESDSRISKTIKNATSVRRVPIHSNLIELGVLSYISNVKKQGAKVLFPGWDPSRGRASPEAEKWFRGFLDEIGLRDETPGKRIAGMHAFRSTFLNRAMESNPPVKAEPLTGHSGQKTKVVREYAGELSVRRKKELLESIQFTFTPDPNHYN